MSNPVIKHNPDLNGVYKHGTPVPFPRYDYNNDDPIEKLQ